MLLKLLHRIAFVYFLLDYLFFEIKSDIKNCKEIHFSFFLEYSIYLIEMNIHIKKMQKIVKTYIALEF